MIFNLNRFNKYIHIYFINNHNPSFTYKFYKINPNHSNYGIVNYSTHLQIQKKTSSNLA